MRKFILIILPVLLVLYFLLQFHYFVMPYQEILGMLAPVCWALTLFVALTAIFLKGTYKKSLWFKCSLPAFALILTGLLFRLQHWEYAGLLILCGSGLTVVLYGIHFLKKKNKTFFDVLKLGYIFLFLLAVVTKMQHNFYWVELSWVHFIAAVLLISIFYGKELRQENKTEAPAKAELSDDGEHLFRYDD